MTNEWMSALLFRRFNARHGQNNDKINSQDWTFVVVATVAFKANGMSTFFESLLLMQIAGMYTCDKYNKER